MPLTLQSILGAFYVAPTHTLFTWYQYRYFLCDFCSNREAQRGNGVKGNGCVSDEKLEYDIGTEIVFLP